jgi:hypothetical protein
MLARRSRSPRRLLQCGIMQTAPTPHLYQFSFLNHKITFLKLFLHGNFYRRSYRKNYSSWNFLFPRGLERLRFSRRCFICCGYVIFNISRSRLLGLKWYWFCVKHYIKHDNFTSVNRIRVLPV